MVGIKKIYNMSKSMRKVEECVVANMVFLCVLLVQCVILLWLLIIGTAIC